MNSRLRDVAPAKFRFDAFVSYCQADRTVAEQLHRGLETFARPLLRSRSVRLFRDIAILDATPSLWRTIRDALDTSRFLMVVLSPAAAKSEWVEREISHFRNLRDQDELIILATVPGVVWSAETQGLGPAEQVPTSLRTNLPHEPLIIDVSSSVLLDPESAELAIGRVSARIRGLALDSLLGEHVARKRKARMLAGTVAVAGISLLTFGVRSAWLDSQSQAAAATFQRAAKEANASASAYQARAARAEFERGDAALMAAARQANQNGQPSVRRVLLAAVQNPEGDKSWRDEATKPFEPAPRRVLRTDGTAFTVARFTPPGGVEKLLLGAKSGGAWLFNHDGVGPAIALPGHTAAITDANFSCSGDMVATASEDRTVRVWSTLDGKLLQTFDHPDGVTSVAFTRYFGRVLSGSLDGNARLWSVKQDWDTEEEPVILLDHSADKTLRLEPLDAVSTNYDGDQIMTRSYFRGSVRLWSHGFLPSRSGSGFEGTAEGVTPGPILEAGHFATSSQFSPVSGQLALITFFVPQGGCCGNAWLIDVRRPTKKRELVGGQNFNCAAFNRTGDEVALGSTDGVVQVWSVADKNPKPAVLLGHQSEVLEVSFDANGNKVLSASDDGTARLWWSEVAGSFLPHEHHFNGFVAVLRGHLGPVRTAQFHSYDAAVLTASDDGTALLWDTDDVLGEATNGDRRESHQAEITGQRVELATAVRRDFSTRPTPELLVRLRADVEPCLTPEDRVRYLGEEMSVAGARWRGCEMACWGRTFPEGEQVETRPCGRAGGSP